MVVYAVETTINFVQVRSGEGTIKVVTETHDELPKNVQYNSDSLDYYKEYYSSYEDAERALPKTLDTCIRCGIIMKRV